jgi:hypothetical protein
MMSSSSKVAAKPNHPQPPQQESETATSSHTSGGAAATSAVAAVAAVAAVGGAGGAAASTTPTTPTTPSPPEQKKKSRKRTRRAEEWEDYFQQLVEYKQDHGHVPTKRNDPLSMFVICQRESYRRLARNELKTGAARSLTPERIERLNKLGFPWEVNDKFEQGYKLLLEFKGQHGHCDVLSMRAENKNNTPLSRFVAMWQKTYHDMTREGRTQLGSLTPDRIFKLKKLGFEFKDAAQNDEIIDDTNFGAMYKELVTFKREHGHCNVPTEAWTRLSNFVDNCRRTSSIMTREGKSSFQGLTPERIKKLKELGFEFKTREDTDNFDKMYKELVTFKQEHGHCNIPAYVNPKEPLSRFVIKLRTTYYEMNKEGKTSLKILTPARIKKLNEIGFALKYLEKGDDLWEVRYEELLKFYEKNHHLRVPAKDKLNRWIATQRKGYKNTMEKMKSDLMAKRTAAAVADTSVYASTDSMEDAETSETTGKWTKYIISSDRIVKLQMLGFEWKAQETMELKNSEMWEKRYLELLKFKLDTGHTRVSRNHKVNPPLGEWVRRQRRNYALHLKGEGGHSLTDERLRKMNQIGFEWQLGAGQRSDRYLKTEPAPKRGKRTVVEDRGIKNNEYDQKLV